LGRQQGVPHTGDTAAQHFEHMNNQAASIAAIPPLAPLEIEATATRKMWTRIVPFVFVLFVINYIDRVNIGFAALTMNKELAIASQQYGFLAGIFFPGYFVFEVPSK
jgi:hypothetical protein